MQQHIRRVVQVKCHGRWLHVSICRRQAISRTTCKGEMQPGGLITGRTSCGVTSSRMIVWRSQGRMAVLCYTVTGSELTISFYAVWCVPCMHLHQEARIEALYSQTQLLAEQLAAAQISANSANTAAAATRRTASSLALQLEACTAELMSLRQTAAAAAAEAAGCAEWAQQQAHTAAAGGSCAGESVDERVRHRDERLIRWFESRTALLLANSGGAAGAAAAAAGGGSESGQAALMALTRQVRLANLSLAGQSTLHLLLLLRQDDGRDQHSLKGASVIRAG